ncbi:unnamed protein product [Spirodela intermedia]|uniref:GAGA-binding transcriptional activator n=1 Tax=Spirodela intermedia TaxID=51605 RepID=A0A7I8IPE5_SPIIN|nr:unnamed protein product [Spirodela intermedia]CAA6659363.1 unnamed protein product [Spirodela intermedia]
MDDGGLGIRNWGGYYDHQPAGDTKPLLPNGTFLHRDCGALPDHPVSMQYNNWIRPRDGNRILHVMPNYTMLSDPQASGNPQTLQMLQPPDSAPVSDEAGGRKEGPSSKKRSQGGRRNSAPRAKKPKKAPAPRDELGDCDQRINLDISGLPTPVCSCTGTPQQCYRWGIGGWQSACCTTTVSMYPLPMSTKRRGARIKVLEKLAGEGYNLSNPIDLSAHWAKHGTNKYVTIR